MLRLPQQGALIGWLRPGWEISEMRLNSGFVQAARQGVLRMATCAGIPVFSKSSWPTCRQHHMVLPCFRTKSSLSFRPCSQSVVRYSDETSRSTHHQLGLQSVKMTSQDLDLVVSYLDLGPADGSTVVLCCHGAPGTHLDLDVFFEPLLQAGARVIVPNFPGTGCNLWARTFDAMLWVWVNARGWCYNYELVKGSNWAKGRKEGKLKMPKEGESCGVFVVMIDYDVKSCISLQAMALVVQKTRICSWTLCSVLKEWHASYWTSSMHYRSTGIVYPHIYIMSCCLYAKIFGVHFIAICLLFI